MAKKKQKLPVPVPVNDTQIASKDDKKKKTKKPQKEHNDMAALSSKENDNKETRAKEDKKKNKNRNRNREKDQKKLETGDKASGVITDARFASAQSDPRFQRVPKNHSRVTIDRRFDRLFSDKSFFSSSAPLDKRGKTKRGKSENPLLHYYLHQEEVGPPAEENAPEAPEKEEEDNTGGLLADGSSDSEPSGLVEEDLSGVDSDFDVGSSTDEEEEEDDEDQYSVGSDVCRLLMANHEDTPLIQHETRRLAAVNMDWDYIKAVDIYVLMSSCLPKGGQIFSVTIYPSEFGLKCMEVESIHGPSCLFDDNKEQNEDDANDADGEEIDNEKLRSYELKRLRYYYAVVDCDSSATAGYLYKVLDGTELLKTSNVLDLRFIPDSMEFKHPPRDVATEAPTTYKEPDFQTRALQHSKVKLSWEEDEPNRKKLLRRKFNANQLDELEFKEYLASDDEESDNDGFDESAVLPSGKDQNLDKYRALLQNGDGLNADEDDGENDMEITFNTGLEDISKRILEKKKDKKSETVWEAHLRKRREKKALRKKNSKYSSEDESHESDYQAEADKPDDFFVEESLGIDAEDVKKSSKKQSNKKHIKHSQEKDGEQEASKAELELLFADDQGMDQGIKGYNMKQKKVKGKKGKETSAEDKLPNVDYGDDPRFSALFTSHHFALDPTAPQFKRSTTYARQLIQKHRKDIEVPEEVNSLGEAPMLGADVASEKHDELRSDEMPRKKVDQELLSLVRSVKRKSEASAHAKQLPQKPQKRVRELMQKGK